jgi:hypothetical protein
MTYLMILTGLALAALANLPLGYSRDVNSSGSIVISTLHFFDIAIPMDPGIVDSIMYLLPIVGSLAMAVIVFGLAIITFRFWNTGRSLRWGTLLLVAGGALFLANGTLWAFVNTFGYEDLEFYLNISKYPGFAACGLSALSIALGTRASNSFTGRIGSCIIGAGSFMLASEVCLIVLPLNDLESSLFVSGLALLGIPLVLIGMFILWQNIIFPRSSQGRPMWYLRCSVWA